MVKNFVRQVLVDHSLICELLDRDRKLLPILLISHLNLPFFQVWLVRQNHITRKNGSLEILGTLEQRILDFFSTFTIWHCLRGALWVVFCSIVGSVSLLLAFLVRTPHIHLLHELFHANQLASFLVQFDAYFGETGGRGDRPIVVRTWRWVSESHIRVVIWRRHIVRKHALLSQIILVYASFGKFYRVWGLFWGCFWVLVILNFFNLICWGRLLGSLCRVLFTTLASLNFRKQFQHV